MCPYIYFIAQKCSHIGQPCTCMSGKNFKNSSKSKWRSRKARNLHLSPQTFNISPEVNSYMNGLHHFAGVKNSAWATVHKTHFLTVEEKHFFLYQLLNSSSEAEFRLLNYMDAWSHKALPCSRRAPSGWLFYRCSESQDLLTAKPSKYLI